MKLSELEVAAPSITRLTRIIEEMMRLDECDASASRHVPGFIGSDVVGEPSVETAKKIRALLRTDLDAKRTWLIAELGRLGIHQ